MPVDAARRIRTARLRGSSEPLIRRGALLLEDALRTASLPGTDRERVLLIRSLSLGVLRPEKSAASVARELEQRVAELALHAVHGADSRAADAQAVFFYDRLDAVVSLIQRLAQGHSSDGGRAWFWRSAVPGWRPGGTAVQTGRVLLGYLINLDSGLRSFVQGFQRLVASRSLDVILHAVQEQDGPMLLQRCGWGGSDWASGSVSGAHAAIRAVPLPRVWQSALIPWIARWGASDPRSLWLVAVALQSWRPEGARYSEVLSEARALLRTIAGSIDGPLPAPSPDDPFLRSVSAETGETGHADDPAIPEASRQLEGVPVYTPHAGFWFLIPLLVRAGFGRAIQDHPEWIDAQMPRRLLRSLAERLAIPPDDPVCLWLSDEAEVVSEPVDHEREGIAGNEVDALIGQWRKALRRWCRIEARLGLHSVVHRPGWVSLSRTHVEVRMPLSDIDLRIRRAGIDIDPGWVSWLGQVIRFSYDAERRPHGTGGIAGR
ncbi:MAG TPA: hypothetical protein VLS44_08870 [Nitrospira sp.]|nr:hypothetical protein [Nitrospira sp.]